MARIDGGDDYILCDLPQGAGRCRGRIGRVVLADGKRHWGLLPGWRSDQGLYYEPMNDRKRRLLGHPPDRGLARRLGHKVKEAYVTPFFLIEPLRFRCPDCGQEQAVDPRTLGFAPPATSVVGDIFR